jgi:hypothetical protein
MHRLYAILLAGLFAGVTGCRSPDFNAKVFAPWCCDDAREFKARVKSYKHVFIVCILEDHWEDRGPHLFALHHYTGTVVRVYRGDSRVSQRVVFDTALDDRAPKNPPSAAGRLAFVFTDQPIDTTFGLDTGEFFGYDADLAPAFECVFSK